MFDDLKIYEKDDITEACDSGHECESCDKNVCDCDDTIDPDDVEEYYGTTFIKVNKNLYYSTNLLGILRYARYNNTDVRYNSSDVSMFNMCDADVIFSAEQACVDIINNIDKVLKYNNPIYIETGTEHYYLCCEMDVMTEKIYIYIVKDCGTV